MTLFDSLEWGVTGVSLVGTVANLYRRWWCFPLWVVSNAAWAAYDIYKGAYPQVALMVVYAALAIWGWQKWKRESDALKGAARP